MGKAHQAFLQGGLGRWSSTLGQGESGGKLHLKSLRGDLAEAVGQQPYGGHRPQTRGWKGPCRQEGCSVP